MKQTINPLTGRFDIVGEDTISGNIKIVDQLPDVGETGIIYLMGNTIYIWNGTEFVQTGEGGKQYTVFEITDIEDPVELHNLRTRISELDYTQVLPAIYYNTHLYLYNGTLSDIDTFVTAYNSMDYGNIEYLQIYYTMHQHITRTGIENIEITERRILTENDIEPINTKTFYLATDEDINTAQQVYNYLTGGKNPIIIYGDKNFLYCGLNTFQTLPEKHIGYGNDHTHVTRDEIQLSVSQGIVTSIHVSYSNYINIIDTETNYPNTYNPVFSYNPATKGYVDTQLATKQGTLTPGTNITINNGVISANVEGALVYKGNVSTISDLPASGNIGDCYYVESELGMYARDGTQRNSIGGTSIDLSSYFDMDTNTTDNITEGNNKFVSQTDINTWNGKQDVMAAGTNISITNNTISAVDTKYSAGTGIDITGTTISADTTTLATKTDLDSKANDSAVVHKTGDESIGGTKTFTNSPVVPTPTNNTDVANKKYVDDSISAATGNITPVYYDTRTSTTGRNYTTQVAGRYKIYAKAEGIYIYKITIKVNGTNIAWTTTDSTSTYAIVDLAVNDIVRVQLSSTGNFLVYIEKIDNIASGYFTTN